jgi:hypothetical protein
MKNVCAVIAIPAGVADPKGDILEDDEAVLVLECLAVYSSGPNCSRTVFAPIPVSVVFTHG